MTVLDEIVQDQHPHRPARARPGRPGQGLSQGRRRHPRADPGLRGRRDAPARRRHHPLDHGPPDRQRRRRRAHVQGQQPADRQDRGHPPPAVAPRPALLPARPGRQGRDPARAPQPRKAFAAFRAAIPVVAAGSRSTTLGGMGSQVPTLRYERAYWRDGLERIVGVDEVGVAPTCGAVVAAAVIMRPELPADPGRARLEDAVGRPARAARPDHPPAGVGDRRRRSIGRRDRPPEHLPRDPPRDAPGDRAGWASTTTSSSTATGSPSSRRRSGRTRRSSRATRKVYSIAAASVVAKVVRDRMMALLVGPLPGLRLGAQPGLRHARAPDGDPRARPDPVPSAQLPRPPADAGRRPGDARPVRRGGRRARPPADRRAGHGHSRRRARFDPGGVRVGPRRAIAARLTCPARRRLRSRSGARWSGLRATAGSAGPFGRPSNS